MYGPKGVGALYVEKKPRVRISAMMSGGGQERGMRFTLSPALCVGLRRQNLFDKMNQESKKLEKLRSLMLDGIRSKCNDIYLNGSGR